MLIFMLPLFFFLLIIVFFIKGHVAHRHYVISFFCSFFSLPSRNIVFLLILVSLGAFWCSLSSFCVGALQHCRFVLVLICCVWDATSLLLSWLLVRVWAVNLGLSHCWSRSCSHFRSRSCSHFIGTIAFF